MNTYSIDENNVNSETMGEATNCPSFEALTVDETVIYYRLICQACETVMQATKDEAVCLLYAIEREKPRTRWHDSTRALFLYCLSESIDRFLETGGDKPQIHPVEEMIYLHSRIKQATDDEVTGLLFYIQLLAMHDEEVMDFIRACSSTPNETTVGGVW